MDIGSRTIVHRRSRSSSRSALTRANSKKCRAEHTPVWRWPSVVTANNVLVQCKVAPACKKARRLPTANSTVAQASTQAQSTAPSFILLGLKPSTLHLSVTLAVPEFYPSFASPLLCSTSAVLQWTGCSSDCTADCCIIQPLTITSSHIRVLPATATPTIRSLPIRWLSSTASSSA